MNGRLTGQQKYAFSREKDKRFILSGVLVVEVEHYVV